MIELFMTIFDKNICIHAEDQSVIGDVAKTFDYFVCEKRIHSSILTFMLRRVQITTIVLFMMENLVLVPK